MSSSFQCWIGSMTKWGKQVWQSKVITHSGMLESGHYVTYMRLRNQWYKCDDAWITEVDEEVVKASHCYLMYYVQKMLYHKRCGDVLILISDTGGGHRASTEAIKATFNKQFGDINIRKVAKGLMKYQPDIIIIVHPLMQHVPLRILRFHKLVTRCYCPSEEVARGALKAGLQPSQIKVFGLPVRPSFVKPICPKVYNPDFDQAVMRKHIKGFSRSENGVEESEMRLTKRKRRAKGPWGTVPQGRRGKPQGRPVPRGGRVGERGRGFRARQCLEAVGRWASRHDCASTQGVGASGHDGSPKWGEGGGGLRLRARLCLEAGRGGTRGTTVPRGGRWGPQKEIWKNNETDRFSCSSAW
ncbi:hypothetical protein KY285_033126 [Solanum tuberosum]|nr:hypothetical protein KY285_033126 [Solanum tuberosum]